MLWQSILGLVCLFSIWDLFIAFAAIVGSLSNPPHFLKSGFGTGHHGYQAIIRSIFFCQNNPLLNMTTLWYLREKWIYALPKGFYKNIYRKKKRKRKLLNACVKRYLMIFYCFLFTQISRFLKICFLQIEN